MRSSMISSPSAFRTAWAKGPAHTSSQIEHRGRVAGLESVRDRVDVLLGEQTRRLVGEPGPRRSLLVTELVELEHGDVPVDVLHREHQVEHPDGPFVDQISERRRDLAAEVAPGEAEHCT